MSRKAKKMKASASEQPPESDKIIAEMYANGTRTLDLSCLRSAPILYQPAYNLEADSEIRSLRQQVIDLQNQIAELKEERSSLLSSSISSKDVGTQTEEPEVESMDEDPQLPIDLRKIDSVEIGTQVSHKSLTRKTRKRVPSVTQCYQCQRFGHLAALCTNNPICRHCAGTHDSRKCNANKDMAPKCTNCHGAHKSSSRLCPAFPKRTGIPIVKESTSTSQMEVGPKKDKRKKDKKSKQNYRQKKRPNPVGHSIKKTANANQDLSFFGPILKDLHSTQAAILDLLRKNGVVQESTK